MANALKKKFFDFPVNAAMLNPSTVPYDPAELALKYIGIVQSGVKATESQVEAVKEGVIAYCKKVDDSETLKEDMSGIEKTWPEMRGRFMNNAGLTQLMLDYGVNSRYFYQFLWLTGRKLFAVALAIKDGLMMPVSGKMVLEQIPPTDWAWNVSTIEPVMDARKQTDYCVQSLLRGAKSIFDGGAGLAPAYSWLYDYPLGENGQQLTLCDADGRLRDYIPLLHGDALKQNKFRLVFGDYCKVAPNYVNTVEIARLTGFLSYFQTFEKKLEIMQHSKNMLVDNGKILADTWTMGASLGRSALTTLWPSDPSDPGRLSPAKNITEAIDEMDRIAKELNLKYVYKIDECNGNPKCLSQVKAVPKCVMFLLGNDVSEDMFDPIWAA